LLRLGPGTRPNRDPGFIRNANFECGPKPQAKVFPKLSLSLSLSLSLCVCLPPRLTVYELGHELGGPGVCMCVRPRNSDAQCVCVCVCVEREREREREKFMSLERENTVYLHILLYRSLD
jgi:hypothetical protein